LTYGLKLLEIVETSLLVGFMVVVVGFMVVVVGFMVVVVGLMVVVVGFMVVAVHKIVKFWFMIRANQQLEPFGSVSNGSVPNRTGPNRTAFTVRFQSLVQTIGNKLTCGSNRCRG
jgi:Zn-dependent membrane protease YugP